ncbi:MerR family transcriptional regulator [Clostridium tetani]|nr:MerR family transcriptional regulator [Clostridium tetani]
MSSKTYMYGGEYMLKIGDFSKLSRISIRMLRHYNDIGLLIPEDIDEFTGYRYYSEAQLPLANRINALKDMGFNLNTIEKILKEYGDNEALEKYLLIKYEELNEKSEDINRRLTLLKSTIKRLRKDEDAMKYNVTLKEMPKRQVASLREIIPSYEMEGILWEKIRKEMDAQNVQFGNPCNTIAVFHDKGYKESDVDVEIQISVEGNYEDTKKVKFKTVEAIEIASVTFKGGYEQIGEVNEAIANWIVDNNYEFNGAMFNIYHVSPAMDKNPENWVSEVCYPVKKK